MGLGFSRWSRIGARGLYAASVLLDERKHRGEALQTVVDAQKARAEDGLKRAARVHPVWTAGTLIVVRDIKVAEQRAQVVSCISLDRT